MEIKRPFSWTSCSCGPFERGSQEGSRRARSPGAAPQTPLPLLGNQATVPLLASDPGTGRGPARGPVATAESPERTRRAVGGPEPSQLEASGCLGLPGAPAAADTEGEAPGHSRLPLAALSPESTAAVQRRPRPLPQLLPLSRGSSQGAGATNRSLFLQGPPAIPRDSTLPLGFPGVSLHWEAGVPAWGVA